MSPDQFALRAFNGVAMSHPLLKGFGLLLLPSRLQGGVMLTHRQRAMGVLGLDALLAQWAGTAR